MGWELGNDGDSHARDLIGHLILVPGDGRLLSFSPLPIPIQPAGPVDIAVDPEPLSIPICTSNKIQSLPLARMGVLINQSESSQKLRGQ